MPVFKKNTHNNVGKNVEKRDHLYTTGVIWQTGAGTAGHSMEASQKPENRTTINPATPLLGMYPDSPVLI